MRFLAVVVAALLDYHYPSAWRTRAQALALNLSAHARTLLIKQAAPAPLVWGACVALIGVLTLLLGLALGFVSKLLGWVFNVLVMYVVVDFGATLSRLRNSYIFLRRGDTEAAHSLLAPASGEAVAANVNLTEEQAIASAALQGALVSIHQRGFAPLFWFLLLGPAGAAVYWIAGYLSRGWAQDEKLRAAAIYGFEVLDWLPQRFTALTFAVVGNFEDALLCWRTQARVAAGASALAVAAGAGASGVRLVLGGAEVGLGELPDADALEGVEAMLWRAALSWLGAVFLIGFALWLG